MEEPKAKKCKKCGEVIYGLSDKDLKHKLLMHSLKHRKEEQKDEI